MTVRDEQQPIPSAPAQPLGAAAAELAAWTAIGILNAVVSNIGRWPRDAGVPLWLVCGTYDVGFGIALGLLSCAAVLGWSRARRALWPRLSARATVAADLAALTAASYAAAFPVLGGDLVEFTTSLVEKRGLPPLLVRVGLVLAVATGIPAAAGAGHLLRTRVLRWIAVAIAIGATVLNHFILTIDYPGAHLYVAWAAASLSGAALATLAVRVGRDSAFAAPSIGAGGPPARGRARARRAALAAAILFSAGTVLVWPRDAVVVAMVDQRGSTLASFLVRFRPTRTFPPPVDVPPELAPWLVDRSQAPAIPPTSASPQPDQIIILYTIDSLKADVIESGAHDAVLPEFTRIKREGVHFTQARSPGTGTSFTLSALFMGKYYSEQYWTQKPGTASLYPWEDDSPRFTNLLSASGVRTVSFVSRRFMLAEYGISRGFDEDNFVEPLRGRSPTGRQLGIESGKRLHRHRAGSLFLWIHNMDAHAPFNMAGIEGTPHERYVREVAMADKEIGILRKLIDRKGWTDRTTIIVSSDHGEAMGDHGTWGHAASMYEELLRIPLLVVGPGVRAQAVDTPVSLIDVGPTVLDMFGLPTPGHYMGQSLVPILRGEPSQLTRPICSETRLKQAMVLPSGLKLIRDQRQGTHEIYDLNTDPGEQRSLMDVPGADRDAQMSLLAKFFEVHTLRRPGYTPPYRSW